MICGYTLRYQNGKTCSILNCKKHKPSLSVSLNDLHRSLSTYTIDELRKYIHHTFTMDYLHNYLGIPQKNKQRYIDRIIELHQRIYQLSIYENSIRWFQQRWRQKHYKQQNTEDPFTLEPVYMVPSMELFQYVDSKNYLYQFRIQELYHHCMSNGVYNPFNREPFDESILEKIKERCLKLSIKSFENPWETPTQAFLDVLYLFEKEGFYTNMDWFLNLSITQIFNIFILFQLFISEYGLDLFDIYLMDPILQENDKDHALLILAGEMKKMIQMDSSIKFLSICTFFLILASIEPRIKRQLPDWIWNIV